MRAPAIAAVLTLAMACAAAADPDRPALLPDIGAPPRLIAVSVNSARRATLRNADLVANLVNGLPPSTRILILTNDRAAFTVLNDRPDRVRFVEVPFENALTIWTQDPFLVLAGDDGDVTLLASKEFERADDRMMADAIARATGYQVRRSSLLFEGGNIVSDEQYILIGANTIRRNALERRVPEEEVVLRFEEALGRRVLVVGPFPQPVAHIDMMLTPLGDGGLLLADPAAGAEIVEQALLGDPTSVAAFERWCERHFFGHPSIQAVSGREGPLMAPRSRDRTRAMIDASRTMAPLLDDVAKSLERYGYRVMRIPFLFGGPENTATAAGEQSLRAGYPMLTYNNVLIESDADGKRVYLPRYGWPALDIAARQTWEALGFATRPIDGLTISAMYGGALRCAVKVLRR